MTMEEAIQQLDGAEMMLLNREFIQFNQAIIMAISALRTDRKSTRLNSSHPPESRMPSSA